MERIHESYVEVMLIDISEREYETKVFDETAYLTELEEQRLEACETLLKIQKEESRITETAEKFKIKVKPVDSPKFSGNIRQYATFLSDYNRIMKPVVGCEAFHLRGSLEGEAAKVIIGVEDDFNEMMIRLDNAYGDPAKLTDCIIGEIKGLKPIQELDYEKFITTVNIIEACWLDIKRAGLEKEMSNISVLSIIERLLPAEQKKEWIKIYHELTDKTDAFQKLITYLLAEKQILEHMNTAISRKTHSEKGAIHVSNLETTNASNDVMDMLQNIKERQEEQQANIDCILNQMSTVKVSSYNLSSNRNDQNATNNYCWLHNTDNHNITLLLL